MASGMICIAVEHHSTLEIQRATFLKENNAKLVMKIKDLFSHFVPRQIISRYYWKVPLLVQNLHFIVKHSCEGLTYLFEMVAYVLCISKL